MAQDNNVFFDAVDAVKKANLNSNIETPTFCWDDYLQNTGADPVDSEAFRHVELSHQSSVQPGMWLEAPISMQSDNLSGIEAWWPAQVVMVSGPLLSLRWASLNGSVIRFHDWWYDVTERRAQPLGWCQSETGGRKKGVQLEPPECVKQAAQVSELNDANWDSFLVNMKDRDSVPAQILESGTGLTPVDQIQCGKFLDCCHSLNPHKFWPVEVVQNHEGRLLLRWLSTAEQFGTFDFNLFFTNERLWPLGHAKVTDHSSDLAEVILEYVPPEEVIKNEQRLDELTARLEAVLASIQHLGALHKDQFPPRRPLGRHRLKVGALVEAVHPEQRHILAPGRVVHVFDDFYYLVEMEDMRDEANRRQVRFLAHGFSGEVSPAHSHLQRGVHFSPPPGWSAERTFSWADFLELRSPSAWAYVPPDSHFDLGNEEFEFCLGEKLELIVSSDTLCPATITRFAGRLMWLHVDSGEPLAPDIMVDMATDLVYPVGWSALAGMTLYPAHALIQAAKEDRLLGEKRASRNWCPKVYFNTRCYYGPHLAKGGIDQLPRHVGPGRIELVLREVLNRLVAVAYKPSKVLKDLEWDPALPRRVMHPEVLRAKLKSGTSSGNSSTKPVEATVELCTDARYLDDFCRQISLRLDACPYLLSVHKIRSACPARCQARSRSKYFEKLPGWKRRYITNFRQTNLNQQASLIKAPERLKCTEETVATHSGADSESDSEQPTGVVNCATSNSSRMQTRGVRLPTYYMFERKKRRNGALTGTNTESGSVTMTKRGRPPIITTDENENKNGKLLTPTTPLAGAPPLLNSNPLHWTTQDLCRYLRDTECSNMCAFLAEQLVDGQAFMLLTLPVAQGIFRLSLGNALKLCSRVLAVKRAFFDQYAHLDDADSAPSLAAPAAKLIGIKASSGEVGHDRGSLNVKCEVEEEEEEDGHDDVILPTI